MFRRLGKKRLTNIKQFRVLGIIKNPIYLLEDNMITHIHLAPACGLYCEVCSDYIETKECHGCRCDCKSCAGIGHAAHCDISQCAASKKVEHCGLCEDFPCTMLSQFANDPVWTTHLVVIDNLKRRAKIGTSKWLEEQKEYWSDDKNVSEEIQHHNKCAEIWNASNK
jgi:hypothetical protein